MKKKKHAKFKKGSLILAAQFIASLLIMFTSLKIAFLPWFYQLLLAVLLILLLGLVHKIIYPKKKEKRKAFRQLTGIILSLVLSFFLVISSSYLNVANAALSGMAKSDPTANYRTYVIDGSYNSIGKLQGQTVGLLTLGDEAEHTKAKQIIKNKLHCETEDYDTVLDMLSSLRRGEIQAVFINDAYKTVCANNYTGWNRNAYCVDKISFTYDEEDTPSTNKNISKNAFTVLISGVDSRKSVTETCRSDVNMLVTIQPETHQILMTSIPRDYYVETTCEASMGCGNGEKDKLTHTGLHGIDTTEMTIEKFMDMDINYHVKVGFSTLSNLVDELGGITVNNPQSFSTGSYSFQQGNIELNGEQALAFARERYSFTEGDKERGRNQMRVLTGILNKVMSPSILKNYQGIMSTLADSFQTNMDTDDISALVKAQLSSQASWKIYTTSLDGTTGTAYCYELGDNASVVFPDDNSISEAKTNIQAVEHGEDPPYASQS